MTTSTICFYNNGTLDKRAFTMLGLSAKSNEDAIGFFGTGFKYAIATLLRSGCQVRVSVVDDEQKYTSYTFFTRRDKFRNKEFDFIYYRHELPGATQEIELPFTTHLGANWKIWQAYRELYTNAKDEGGDVCLIDTNDNDAVNPDNVCVYVTDNNANELINVYNKHDTYFLDRKTLAHSHRMRCVERVAEHDNAIYYKTMFTGTLVDKPTLFTYDYTKTIQLTEDRTISDTWYIKHHISELWLQGMSYDLLIKNLPRISRDDYYEYYLHSDYCGPSEQFIKACSYLIEHQRPMPMWARDVYTKTRPFDEQIEAYKPNRYEKVMLEKALIVLKHHNCIIDTTKLITCASLPDGVLGLYRDNNIYIAKQAFEQGFTKLLGTLFEEHTHCVEGHEDYSNRMQNFLVDKCAMLMEQIYAMEDDYRDK